MRKVTIFIVCLITCISQTSIAQINEDKLGAWYMYFSNTNFGEGPWGVQGDIQYRNWDLGGDLGLYGVVVLAQELVRTDTPVLHL